MGAPQLNSGDHNYSDLTQPIGSQGHATGQITIGNDVWLDAHGVILRNAKVGDGAVVAAGAVGWASPAKPAHR
jgi:acetyltransferase-like isoleucine patch superfamily enzyme